MARAGEPNAAHPAAGANRLGRVPGVHTVIGSRGRGKLGMEGITGLLRSGAVLVRVGCRPLLRCGRLRMVVPVLACHWTLPGLRPVYPLPLYLARLCPTPVRCRPARAGRPGQTLTAIPRQGLLY